MMHIFDVDVAREVGVNGAIFLNNLYFWIEKNRANETHFHDGRYWTYNSIKAYEQLFPYWTAKQIRTTVQKLIDGGYVYTGHFSDNKYDRRLWYTLTDKGLALINRQKPIPEEENDVCPNGRPLLPEWENENDPRGNCLYRYKPDSKTTDENHIINYREKPKVKHPTIEEIQAYCIERGNDIDPEQFYDYYQSNGWMVGSHKMKDWKAAVRTWERNQKKLNHTLGREKNRDSDLLEVIEWENKYRR